MKRKYLPILSSVVVFIGLGVAAPAHAAEADYASPAGTEAALASVDGTLKLAPVGGAGLGKLDLKEGSVEIPADPTLGVVISAKGADMTVGLPGASDASRGVALADGTVTYSADGFSNSVIASDAGVQLLTTIGSSAAPTRYEYAINAPKGASLQDVGGGMTAVVDSDGTPVVVILPAWAKDARGANVPTHYALEGDKLVQYVEHTNAGVAYPVVADPQFAWMGVLPTVKLNRSETYDMRYGSVPSKIALCTAMGGVAGVAVAGPCALSLAILSAKAGAFYENGNCLQVLIGPGILGGVEYNDSYCR